MRVPSILLMTAALCAPSFALPSLPLGDVDLNYQGYSWEVYSGGGPGQAGNVLYAIGEVVKILDGVGTEIYDPVDEGAEMTFSLAGLVSQGAASAGPDLWHTEYVGGTVEVYFDATPDYNAATGPGSYTGVTDGLLWLSADVVSFCTDFDSAGGIGSFLGTFQTTGGLAACCFSDLWTWGGSSSTTVPDGWTYHHTIIGDLNGTCIPEPGTCLLVGTGLIGLIGIARRR